MYLISRQAVYCFLLQDAYIIGENRALSEFFGIVIAVIRRLDDIEDKLVVCAAHKSFTKEEIEKAVEFQEKYFDSHVIMKSDSV